MDTASRPAHWLASTHPYSSQGHCYHSPADAFAVGLQDLGR